MTQPAPSLATALAETRTAAGVPLADLCDRTPVLLVFLRHLGCTFCREALADIAAQRPRIQAAGTRIVLVHMGPADAAAILFRRYSLTDVDHACDPDRRLYRAAELARGRLGQLFGLKCFLRGIAATLRGHVVGRLAGDGFQMPGVLLVHRGRVLRAFRHASAADRPDYCELSGAP